MKNVTDSLKPSDSQEVAAPKAKPSFESNDFTITVSDFYMNVFSRHNPQQNKEALEQFKKEARAAGYKISENCSIDTGQTYIRFYRFPVTY